MLLMKKEKPENSRNKLFDGHSFFSSTDAHRMAGAKRVIARANFLGCKRMEFRGDVTDGFRSACFG